VPVFYSYFSLSLFQNASIHYFISYIDDAITVHLQCTMTRDNANSPVAPTLPGKRHGRFRFRHIYQSWGCLSTICIDSRYIMSSALYRIGYKGSVGFLMNRMKNSVSQLAAQHRMQRRPDSTVELDRSTSVSLESTLMGLIITL